MVEYPVTGLVLSFMGLKHSSINHNFNRQSNTYVLHINVEPKQNVCSILVGKSCHYFDIG